MSIALVADPLEAIPGPPPMPFWGSRGNQVQFFLDPIAYLRRLHREHGSIALFVRGRPGIVFAFGPEYNRQILGNPRVFHSTGITMPGPARSRQRQLGFGLLSMNDEQHRQQRRLVMPPLHRKQIEGYRDAIVAVAARTLDGWRPGQVLDMARAMKQLSLRVTSQILFGLDEPREGERVGRMMEQWLQMNTSFLVRLFPVDRPGTPYARMLRFAETLQGAIVEMIERKRTQRPETTDVLSLLIRARDEEGASMTDEELIGQTNILFGAAHVTTSDALSWTLFLLAQHPAALTALLDELRGTLRGEAPSMAQLEQLPWLDCVLKESLRILPPPVYNCRLTTEPVELGPYRLPQGSTVAFSHYITHHMPELYAQPEAFRPERWRTITPAPYAYIPFGAGPRMCIGEPFAMMTMKLVLSLVVQRFRFTVTPGARIDRKVTVTLSPKHGMPMRLERQDGRFCSSPVRGTIHEMVELP